MDSIKGVTCWLSDSSGLYELDSARIKSPKDRQTVGFSFRVSSLSSNSLFCMRGRPALASPLGTPSRKALFLKNLSIPYWAKTREVTVWKMQPFPDGIHARWPVPVPKAKETSLNTWLGGVKRVNLHSRRQEEPTHSARCPQLSTQRVKRAPAK